MNSGLINDGEIELEWELGQLAQDPSTAIRILGLQVAGFDLTFLKMKLPDCFSLGIGSIQIFLSHQNGAHDEEARASTL